MNLLKNWWNNSSKQEKAVQIIVAFLVFAYSAYINNASVSIATGLAAAYILYDCYQKKSFSGFRIARENWLGIAIYLGSVLLASLLLGDKPSIQMAFKYVYWALPFVLAAYLSKLADIRYAAAVGALLSVAVSSINVAYLNYLFLHGEKLALGQGVRIGAFSANANHYAMLLICTLPLLLCFYADKKLRENTLATVISIAVTVVALWALWKTGSRGAMIGLFLGFLSTLTVFCFQTKNSKLFLKGVLIIGMLVGGFLLVGIPGGEERVGDVTRLRQLRSCYAMWNDHKLAGVGLENWQKEYADHYLLTDEIRQDALQRYLKRKEEARKKAAAKKAAIQNTPTEKNGKIKAREKSPIVRQQNTAAQSSQKAIEKQETDQQKAARRKAAVKKAAARRLAVQNRTVQHEADLPIPHNVVAWFFSTTGLLGGIGYLLFVVYYCRLLYRKMREYPDEWIIFAGLWIFLAVAIHGLVDAGITNKEAARLVYLVLGLALSNTIRRKV